MTPHWTGGASPLAECAPCEIPETTVRTLGKVSHSSPTFGKPPFRNTVGRQLSALSADASFQP